MNKYFVGILTLLALHASSNAMSGRITRAAGAVVAARGLIAAAAGIVAAGGFVATQLPNSPQPVEKIKSGDYRLPQKIKFKVVSKDPKAHLVTGLKKELINNTVCSFEGEMVEERGSIAYWRYVTVSFLKPDVKVCMTLRDNSSVTLGYNHGPRENSDFFIFSSNVRDKLYIQALYSPEQSYDETPKSSLSIIHEDYREEAGRLKRWFGWMKFW